MKLYNSLTNSYKTVKKDAINIYVCGPTVYDYIHIGNARPMITYDILVRILKFNNIKVNYLQNITDVDDKIINRAILENTTEKQISEFYTQYYLNNMNDLNIIKPNQIILISVHIRGMIDFTKELIEKGFAYEKNGNVYFRINAVKEYGQLSNQTIDQINKVNRIEIDSNKENHSDFVLWKTTIQGVVWDSPWGKGRPGWHTECVYLIDWYFKKQTIDIHGGGIDLIFPHHENERAQYFGKNKIELANLWMHNGHLNLNNEKMSKSLGNIFKVNDFIEKYDPNTLRYLMYTTHYRQPLNITSELIEQVRKEVFKIDNLIKQVKIYLVKNNLSISFNDNECSDHELTEFQEFINNLEDDLNTANCLTNLNTMIKLLNQQLKIGKIQLNLYYIFLLMLDLLGLKFNHLITVEEEKLIIKWENLKQQKQYQQADEIRKILIAKKII